MDRRKEFWSGKVRMAVSEDIRQAKEIHARGDLATAEELYRRILGRAPQDPDAHHLLGVIQYQRGEYAAALASISRADQLRPDHPATLNNLAGVLRELGRGEEALRLLTRAITLQPDLAEAHTNLGTVCSRLGRPVEAEAAYQRALTLNPRDSKALTNLGNLALHKGEYSAALAWYGRALALVPDSPFTQYNLGCALLKMGRLAEAEAALGQSLKADPSMVDAMYALSALHRIRYEFPRALALAQQAIALRPDRIDGHLNLAETFFAMNLFGEALDCLGRAAALDPDSLPLHHLYGKVYQSLGKINDAQQALDRALALAPGNTEVLCSQGNLAMDQGRFARSAALAREMLRLRPGNTAAWYLLAQVSPTEEKEGLAREIEILLEKGNFAPLQRMRLHFALGGLLEDLAEYDRAFAHLKEANDLKRKTFHFSLEPQKRMIARICEVYDEEALERFAGKGYPSRLPIFIMGMPRSGTTLTEQILSSHPDVHGGGELRLVNETITAYLRIQPLDDTLDPDIVLRARDLPELGRRYVEQLREYAPAARLITDKMPGNYLFLGLIALILPQAKIIHCVRSPMDTCWSIYKKLFTHGHQYAYELEELGRYYLLYQRLMEHWRKVLPGRFLELCYEEMVADQEGQTRRLLEFCGLDWRPDCLYFERNRRPVHTASAVQVRQPLHNRSVGLWKRYEQGLQPLLTLLQSSQESSSAQHHIS